MTPYQIANEIEQRFPQEFAVIEKPVGEKDTGQHNPVAQYVVRILSGRIRGEKTTNIKGKFLYHIEFTVTKIWV